MTPRRRGGSLIEATVVMALFAIFSAIMAKTVWSTIRIERADAAAFDHTVRRCALADQLREDVAQSTEAPAKFGEHIAGGDCLILTQQDTHIVYTLTKKNVVRTVIAKENTTARHLPVGEDIRVEFSRDNNVVTMRFYDVRPRSEHKHPVQFMAALGGDLK